MAELSISNKIIVENVKVDIIIDKFIYIFFCLFSATSNSRASLPPDGTTFSHLSLGEKQTRTIPPYSFWNFQVIGKLSVKTNYTFLYL